MSRVVIFGSRTFAPLSVVRDDVKQLPDNSVVIAAGVSAVVNVARDTALDRGFTCHDIPLSTDRQELLTEAQAPDVDAVIAYAARDPETRQITEGTAGLIALLGQHGVTVDVRNSPLTAVQSLAYHHMEIELTKLRETPDRRRGYREKRVLQAALELLPIRAALVAWLDAHDGDPDRLRAVRESLTTGEVPPPEDSHADAWVRNLRRYSLISGLLDDAKAVMPAIAVREAA